MKIMKKILIGFGVVVVLVVAAAMIIPMIVKNDIKAAVDKEIAKSINADVVFDVNNFSLSVFRHFPNVTVEIKELGVFNRAPFEGVPLFVVDRLDLEVNLTDILFGDKLRLKGITIVRPQINIQVLKDGQANYNITIPSTDTAKVETKEPGKFSFGMDITFKSPENTFKSLLSLVPGIYTKDFAKIETKGDLSFAGLVKGTFSDRHMPAFTVTLKVNDAMFKYPELSTAVNNINMDLLIDNKDGVVDHTVIDLRKLHLDFGANPVDARLLIENLKDYRMDGNLQAKLNLAELNTMIPMQGLEMKGLYSMNATAKA